MLAVHLAPARILVAGSVVAVAVFLLNIWLAWLAPWLGLKFDARTIGEGIVVARVFDRGPAYETLRPGDVIIAIELPDGTSLPLTAATIARAADTLPTYAAFDRFFEDHRALWRAISQDAVTLVRADGTRAVLHPHRHRDVTSLPGDFWAMDLLAATALLIGVGVLAFRPSDVAPRMLFVACVGLVFTAAILALSTGRELTLHTEWVPTLRAIQLFGEHLALFGIVALLWVYPRLFRPTRYLLPVAALFLAAWLASVYRWWPSPAPPCP